MASVKAGNAVAAEIMEGALAFCAQKLARPDRAELVAALRAGDSAIYDSLCYGLALELAKYLGSTDETIQAIYAYDPEYATGSEEALPSPGLSLIVRASRRSAALSSLVDSVVTALTEERRQVLPPKASALCCALDVHIVDEAEVQNRSGYGALVHSLHVRPIEIWRR